MDLVLNRNCVPRTEEDANLFREKKKFIHSVFSTSLQMDRGNKFVREYEYDFDAQALYSKLHDFYTKSVRARVNASDILR